eukprot:scaffold66151_cov72-Cyclotella_meneghiniana.AAC.2
MELMRCIADGTPSGRSLVLSSGSFSSASRLKSVEVVDSVVQSSSDGNGKYNDLERCRVVGPFRCVRVIGVGINLFTTFF